jgi:hypothetical protein
MTTNRRMEVTGSFRRNEQGQIILEARSPRFIARALHPMARVGTVPVVGILVSKGVLTGLLLGTPKAGDELRIRYVPEPEVRTGVRFNLAPPNVA